VTRIVTFDGDLDRAAPGDAVTLMLSDELDIARGDVFTSLERPPEVSNQFAAHLIWMSEDPLLPGRSYLLKIGTKTVPASVTELKHRLDVDTLGKHAAKTLALNEVGFCNLATVKPVAFDPYADNHEMGGFILIDRFTNATAAAGLIAFGLRRATNIHRQELAVGKDARARLKHQKPAILWFTGLSGAGKSTVANIVEARLCARGVHTLMLDGDNIRQGLCKDLGFTEADRVENIRRVGEVAKLMTEAGLIVLCSFISPFRAERQMVRELVEDGEFIEIFVDTPIDVCVARDPKGLYKRARAGEIKNFSGVDQRYEPPDAAEIVLHGARGRPEVLAGRVLDELVSRKLIDFS
jgi:bifunctional enzyme CysN/CysC